MPVRAMYIWKLADVIAAEGSVAKMIEKARRARLRALWVKLADGRTPSPNTQGTTGQRFAELVDRCNAAGIEPWGWHVPHCTTADVVTAELATVSALADRLGLKGLIMDAEGGGEYFQGTATDAAAYGVGMRTIADRHGIPLAISSNDIPVDLPNWLPKFNKIAFHATLNFPQVYYGGSPSVVNRLDRAVAANAHVTLPFGPVGAAWIGDGGGCASASACAERASQFIALAHQRGYSHYAFWHWAGAPLAFWAVLNTTRA
jgi:hypothetical protein